MNIFSRVLALGICLGVAAPAFAEHCDGHHKNMKEHMAKADVNGDGKISKQEFFSKKEEKFNKWDTNKDGSLDATEQSAMWEKMKGHHDKDE